VRQGERQQQQEAFVLKAVRDGEQASQQQPAPGAGQFHFATHTNPPCVWPDYLAGQAEKPVRVVVVDDDAHMRKVIAQELMGDPRTVVVGQAETLREGRRLVREHDFDVMLVDLNLGDGIGYDLITYAKNVRSTAEVVVVSILEGNEDAMRAFELGAAGFLVKNSWFGNFVQAVLQVANGGASITPSLARRLLLKVDRNTSRTETTQPVSKGPAKLSEREKEILRMIANGFTSVEIGSRLTISDLTVNTHVKNIHHKLHVRTRAQAVSCASTWGFRDLAFDLAARSPDDRQLRVPHELSG
jgi:DNA-binding NarL/FixJ family response regulator